MIVCEGGEKPLVFEQLMKKYNSILCFTRSVETAHRLALLLHLLGFFFAFFCLFFDSMNEFFYLYFLFFF